MRSFLYWNLLAIVLVLAMACSLLNCSSSSSSSDDDVSDDDSSGGDDDSGGDDAGDDTAADDDSGGDDDTAGLEVTNLDQSECLGNQGAKDGIDYRDVVRLTWQGGVLKVEHLNAWENCGYESVVSASVSGSTVYIVEKDVGSPANCECFFNVNYEVDGISINGDFTVQIKRENATDSFCSVAVANDGTAYKYETPFVEMIAKSDANNPQANQPFNIRMGVCKLEDNLDPQIYFVTMSPNTGSTPTQIWGFSLGLKNLDSPGQISDTCKFVVKEHPGLPAGQYQLVAPSLDPDTGIFSTVANPEYLVVE